MAKKKVVKRARKSSAKKAAPVSGAKVGGIRVGARVRVVGGDYGNSSGTVAGLSGAGVLVRLDTLRTSDPLPFDAAELVVGGPLDRF